ncbi:hypothetical protein D9M70_585170 [compost metagenome]
MPTCSDQFGGATTPPTSIRSITFPTPYTCCSRVSTSALVASSGTAPLATTWPGWGMTLAGTTVAASCAAATHEYSAAMIRRETRMVRLR